jgi:hypothetical protein
MLDAGIIEDSDGGAAFGNEPGTAKLHLMLILPGARRCGSRSGGLREWGTAPPVPPKLSLLNLRSRMALPHPSIPPPYFDGETNFRALRNSMFLPSGKSIDGWFWPSLETRYGRFWRY